MLCTGEHFDEATLEQELGSQMPAIGHSRIVEQLHTAESASVGNSPQLEHIMKAQLAAQEELVREFRELRKTIGDTAERYGDKVDTLVQEAEEGVQDLHMLLFCM